MAIVTCSKCGTKNRVDERAESAQAVCGKCGAKLNAADTAHGAHPLTATESNFSQIISADKMVLVDFWATWCPPCRALTPILEQLSQQADGRYVIAKLNTDENPSLASRFQIEGIPTMLFFKRGQLIDRLVGLADKQTIERKLLRSA